MIEFTIPGEPVPYARTGGGKNTPRFTPAKQRNMMGAIKQFAAAAMKGREPMTGAIELKVLAVYAWPQSWSQRKKDKTTWKTTRPDSDNLAKLLKDALNTVAWIDDAQVCSEHIWKKYGPIPQLSVRIQELTSPGPTPKISN